MRFLSGPPSNDDALRLYAKLQMSCGRDGKRRPAHGSDERQVRGRALHSKRAEVPTHHCTMHPSASRKLGCARWSVGVETTDRAHKSRANRRRHVAPLPSTSLPRTPQQRHQVMAPPWCPEHTTGSHPSRSCFGTAGTLQLPWRRGPAQSPTAIQGPKHTQTAPESTGCAPSC